MQTLSIPAQRQNLNAALEFAAAAGERAGLEHRQLLRLQLCAEEIFLNICSHAYAGDVGLAHLSARQEGGALWLCFADSGIPFNPLAHAEPDLAAPAAGRTPGGLGIVMVRRYFPAACYTRRGSRNILCLPLGPVP